MGCSNNYLLEFWIAELFDCRPFVNSKKTLQVPFYLVYRESDRHVPSCFGGAYNPFRQKEANIPGVHYLKRADRWATCAWEKGKSDAGIIIIVHDPRVKSVEMAVIGFSGIATEAMGEALIYNENMFWPLRLSIRGREVGVFVCTLDCSIKKSEDSGEQIVKTEQWYTMTA